MRAHTISVTVRVPWSLYQRLAVEAQSQGMAVPHLLLKLAERTVKIPTLDEGADDDVQE